MERFNSELLLNTQEGVTNPELQRLLSLEERIGAITLDPDGTINFNNNLEAKTSDRAEEWKKKEGVIDVKEFEGAVIVVFNSNEKIPEGCPDLVAKSRSGEYDPETKVCYVDLSNSWSFLHDKYIPSDLEHYVRHELRHHLVNILDSEFNKINNLQQHRYHDWDKIKETNEDTAIQLAYLDELHSQYFDLIEGDIFGKSFFVKIDSEFYTIAKKGTHLEVATTKPENAEVVLELFSNIQASILIYWANKETKSKENVLDMVRSVGAVLATERSLADALVKIKNIIKQVFASVEIKENTSLYLKTYKPKAGENMPVVDQILSDVIIKL